MPNSLGRDLENGELVVMRAVPGARFQELEYRVYQVANRDPEAGGMRMHTFGTVFYGRRLTHSDGTRSRLGGDSIDPEETAAYQAEHGRFLAETPECWREGRASLLAAYERVGCEPPATLVEDWAIAPILEERTA